MATTTLGKEQLFSSEHCLYHQSINDLILSTLQGFDRQIRRFALFNLIFLAIGFSECFLLLFFFTFLAQSALFAFTLAVVFLTFFSYFILRLYVQAQKPIKFELLKRDYARECQHILGYHEESPEFYPIMANAYARLSNALQGREEVIYFYPDWIKSADFLFKYVSSWLHWYSVQQFQEKLLLAGVEEHIKWVKTAPTSLAAHSSLANAYIMLSALYMAPHVNREMEERWTLKARYRELLQRKFQDAAKKAIEEFKILNFYAPDDSWVHAQLACSYRDLNMPFEEIKEYEILLRLSPEDRDTLFKLGMRYFQQGFNSQGLRIYEQLKRLDAKRAQDLIHYYGMYTERES